MKKTNCPNCQSPKNKIVLNISKESDFYLDYLKIDYKDTPRFYVRCKDCGLVYRSPILDEKEKELLYEHFRDVELRGENKYEYFQRITSLPPEQSENYEKSVFLEKYLPKKGRVLDVGYGAGVFLYTFRNYFPGWKTLGIEPTNGFADVAKENNINIIYGYLKKDTFDTKFDLITLIHVLEHMDNFKETLSTLKHHLKKDGLLYIEVPSVKDIGYFPKSHEKFMCQHDIIFSREVLENVLTELGYSIAMSEYFISIRKGNNLRTIIKSTNDPPTIRKK